MSLALRAAEGEQTYYRWRKEYGSLKTDQARRMKELAKQYGRYGYRRVTALLRDAGWTVNRKRVERIVPIR